MEETAVRATESFKRETPALANGAVERHAEMVRTVANSSAPGRSAVAASWRRSLTHLSLDPQSVERRPRLEAQALRERRDGSELLLRVAVPVLKRVAGVALDDGVAALLVDAHGVIVEALSRPSDKDLFDAVGLAPGADWSEASEGTNGIGTCLADRRAVTIGRGQHFFARNSALSCISAPIEAPDGSLASAIDISSFREKIPDVQMRMISLIVQDAAIEIGSALFHAAFAHARILTLGTEPAHGPSLIAVDLDDLVICANRAARRTLRLTSDDLSRHPPIADLLETSEEPRSDLTRALRSEVMRALSRANGNVPSAARDLKIGRATLYRKMKDLGLS